MGNCLINNCVNLCCRECNCLIFPAPRSNYGWQFEPEDIAGGKVELLDFNNITQQRVPYIQISSQKTLRKSEIIIYFHGNAQDIFHSINFVTPIFIATQITVLCLEYPTYSCYNSDKKYFISDRIKQNSVQFHNFVQKRYKIPSQKIYIIGRSIGSGPASYLASQVKCKKLALISPFDTIRKVSQGLVGCIGIVVKNHFDNEQSMLTHKGELLVVHGMIDQVINFRHGSNLVSKYETTHKTQAVFIQPSRMSHNYFEMQTDIVNPIRQFLKGQAGYRQSN